MVRFIRIDFGEASFRRIQYVRLIRLDLKEVIATVLFQHFQQRTLCEDRIASEQLEHRIVFEQFVQMGFEATGLIGLVAMNIETHECDFDVMSENVEH